jgi:uncharacterized protein HemY
VLLVGRPQPHLQPVAVVVAVVVVVVVAFILVLLVSGVLAFPQPCNSYFII